MTDIELIQADLKSIADARKCLESMKSIYEDSVLTMEFQFVCIDLTALTVRLQRKLDKLKNEGGAS